MKRGWKHKVFKKLGLVAAYQVATNTSMKRGWKLRNIPKALQGVATSCCNQYLNEKRMKTYGYIYLENMDALSCCNQYLNEKRMETRGRRARQTVCVCRIVATLPQEDVERCRFAYI